MFNIIKSIFILGIKKDKIFFNSSEISFDSTYKNNSVIFSAINFENKMNFSLYYYKVNWER